VSKYRIYKKGDCFLVKERFLGFIWVTVEFGIKRQWRIQSLERAKELIKVWEDEEKQDSAKSVLIEETK
jgi:hypothetical protein